MFNKNKHPVKIIASLIYDVDFRTFDKFYKNKNQAIQDISKSLLKEDEKDENLKVIFDNGEILGIILLWIRKKPSFVQSLLSFTSFKLLAIDILDYFVLSNVERDDIHIAELAITPQYRGKGFGSKIIKKVIEYGIENNFKRVTLDADFRNNEARKLYEKIGFKTFNKKEFLKRGMFNMEYVLDK